MQSILPDNAGTLLAQYGKYDFGDGALPSFETTALLTLLQSQATQKRSAEAVREIRNAAFATGGWAIYGAASAVRAFFPSETESPITEEILEERIKFIRSLGMANIRAHLSTADQCRWRKLFPGEI